MYFLTQILGGSINFCKITIYTDGITEALNNNLEMLDMEGWKKIVERVKALSDTSLPVENLLAEVKAFIGDAEQADDITLLVITSHF